MAKLNRKQISDAIMALLKEHPQGIRRSDIQHSISKNNEETPPNTIHGTIQFVFSKSTDIIRIAKGLYQLKAFQDLQPEEAIQGQDDAPAITANGATKEGLIEADFYESFAHWLVEVVEEVTSAVALGGNILKGKWGTPDVLGVRKPQAHDILKFETQVVSAEIKLDSGQPIVAFGQAVAYRLFSHRTYIVVPRITGANDLTRLEALCSLHGIGLVTFDLDKLNPGYTSVIPPAEATPDMFYANEIARRLLEASPKLFKKLF